MEDYVGWAWHVHHVPLLEWCTSYQKRVRYVRVEKPLEEQELRLRWFTPLQHPERVPQAYGQAWQALVQTGHAYAQATEAYLQATEAYKDEIEALHREEHPDCPWDGSTIFAKRSA